MYIQYASSKRPISSSIDLPHEHERSVHGVDWPPLDLQCTVLREPSAGAVSSGPEEVAERAQDRGKRAARRVVEAPVGPLQPAPADTDLGVFVHQAKQRVERPGSHLGVGVEREDVFRAALTDCDVRGPGEADVRGRSDERDSGKLARHHLGGAVARVVVHDDNVHRNCGWVQPERREAVAKKVARPERDDCDVEPAQAGFLRSRNRALRRPLLRSSRSKSADGNERSTAAGRSRAQTEDAARQPRALPRNPAAFRSIAICPRQIAESSARARAAFAPFNTRHFRSK